MDLQRVASSKAAEQHGAISRGQLTKLGIDASRRQRWIVSGFLTAAGPRSYVLSGTPESWMRSVWCTHLDVEKRGFIAGRTAARLHGLDGFTSDVIEIIVPRRHRNLVGPWTLRSTGAALDKGATQFVERVRCLTMHRLILESGLFRFSRDEVESSIDSALRKQGISEQKLRTDVVKFHRSSVNGSRVLLDAMVDSGGQSRLERRLLKLVREAGLPRPEPQRIYRDDSRFVARVDFVFAGGHVVEVEGHGFHSTPAQRDADERRRNALRRLVPSLTVFTYRQVTYDPEYVLGELHRLGITS